MAVSLVQSEFTYQSGTAPTLYTFTIVSDLSGTLSVRDIQDPYGFILSPYTQIPKSVTDDIQSAMLQVEGLLSSTSAFNGSVNFVGETTKVITFPSVQPNLNYRVHLTSDIFAPFKVTNKTLTSFTIEAGAEITATVSFDVFI